MSAHELGDAAAVTGMVVAKKTGRHHGVDEVPQYGAIAAAGREEEQGEAVDHRRRAIRVVHHWDRDEAWTRPVEHPIAASEHRDHVGERLVVPGDESAVA